MPMVNCICGGADENCIFCQGTGTYFVSPTDEEIEKEQEKEEEE